MAKVREDYEAKLCEMLARIAATEAERDKALTELQPRAGAKLNKETEEKIRHIREDYEVKLTSLRNDQKKLQQMERQHKKDQAAQKRQQEELQRYMNELQAMKRSKVGIVGGG
jgi:bisphosphoglycerate-dependent phosphoglycerate mutase